MNLTKTGIKESGLVLFYDFSEQGTVAIDKSGKGNHGQYIGTLNKESYQGSPSIRNTSGTLGLIQVPFNNSTKASCMTIIYEVGCDSWSSFTNSDTRFVSKTEAGGWALACNTRSPYISVRASGAYATTVSYSSMVVLSPGRHIFIGTYDGRYLNLFRDGILAAATKDVGDIKPIEYSVDNPLVINGEPGETTYVTSGYTVNVNIIGVKLYNVAFTSSEVVEYYDKALSNRPSGLVSEWKFKEIGSVAVDTGGAGNHGSLQQYATRVSGGVSLTSSSIIMNSSASLLSQISGNLTIYAKITCDYPGGTPSTYAIFTTEDIAGIGGFGLWNHAINGRFMGRYLVGAVSVYTSSYTSTGSTVKLCATHQSGVAKIYMDGILLNTATVSNALIFTSASIRAGQLLGGAAGGNMGNPIIHNIKVYNRALSDSEVASLE